MSEPKYVTEEREKARSLSNADLISFLVSVAQGDDYDGMFTTRGENICQVYEDVAIERLENLRSELAALREQVRWIPVSERLPEDGQSVLVYDRIAQDCVVVRYENIKWKYYAFEHSVEAFKSVFTHWMPLPSFPESED